jgi:tetratricopeptide (TPR) repeat protein
MSNKNSDPVFQLIKTLTSSEKRHFRLFTSRRGANEGVKFLQLFDVLAQQDTYDDDKVLAEAPDIKRAQLANLKANLYKQLLSSLRLYHANQNLDIQLHEQLDYARVLYNKGLYQQSLKILEKVKTLSQQAELPHIALQAVEFEKLIESQYITRSIGNKAEELAETSVTLATHLSQMHGLSNFSLRLYSLYLRMGHARNQEEYNRITAFFQANLPDIDLSQAGFFEKLHLYQANVWYNYIIQDFKACYRYAQKWTDLFEANPTMKETQPMLYIKGLHNLLAALYHLLYYSKFKEVLQKLEDFAQDDQRAHSPNIEMLLFQHIYTNKINIFFLEGRFTEGLRIIPDVLKGLLDFRQQLDPHRTLIFYFKIASLYFGSGDFKKAIIYLNKVIHYKDMHLREDVQCFARILSLIAHFEAGEDEVLEYQIKSVYHFLGKMNNQQQMQVEIFKFLRSLGTNTPHQLKDAFIALKEKLIAIASNPFERRPFLYLDIISWLESKIENVPVQEIMQKKFRAMKGVA